MVVRRRRDRLRRNIERFLSGKKDAFYTRESLILVFVFSRDGFLRILVASYKLQVLPPFLSWWAASQRRQSSLCCCIDHSISSSSGEQSEAWAKDTSSRSNTTLAFRATGHTSSPEDSLLVVHESRTSKGELDEEEEEERCVSSRTRLAHQVDPELHQIRFRFVSRSIPFRINYAALYNTFSLPLSLSSSFTIRCNAGVMLQRMLWGNNTISNAVSTDKKLQRLLLWTLHKNLNCVSPFTTKSTTVLTPSTFDHFKAIALLIETESINFRLSQHKIIFRKS